MFSSKSNRGKWTWAFVDLIVVIIGIYIAFLLQSTSAVQNDRREQVKVYSALKMELEAMRVVFPEFATSNINFLDRVKDRETFDISSWRFVEPQYAYKIIEYAINVQNTEIVDFEMYNQLQKLYVGIKQLEHMELLVNEISGEYQYLIPELKKNHPLNLERTANNRSRIYRFKMFLQGRAGNLNRTSKMATDILSTINERLGPEQTKAINQKFIAENAPWIGSEVEAVQLGLQHFPDLTEKEIMEIYRQAKGIATEPQKDASPD